ncbi:MAG: tetratricopeptide repeat protein [Planctomycetota bacterium]
MQKAPVQWAAVLPIALVTALGLLPFVLYLLHRADPVLAVEATNALSSWTVRALLAGGACALLALLLYPPAPAWIRRFVDRQRRSWAVDRAPLLRARKELEHCETAQKHFEVARLAWIRTELPLVGPHAHRAVELDPSMPQAQHLLGQFLLEAGRPQQAAAAFAEAERLDPGHSFGEALLLEARARYVAGDREQALARFEQHQAQHGGGHRSNYWRAEALLAAGRREDAARAFAEAAKDPGQRLPTEENWFRALARVRCWRLGVRA